MKISMITITNTNTGKSKTLVPSQYKWSLNNVNAADSGRTYDGTMYTNRVTQKRKLELEFHGLSWEEASEVLQVVNSEYCRIQYPDMLTGALRTGTFYAGDQECSAYVWWTGKKILSTINFNVIER